MTKKETFINEVMAMAGDAPENVFSQDAFEYWNSLCADKTEKPKNKFTENGKLILTFVKDNENNYNNLFKAKDIAEALGISSRTVSGAIRKLVTDGYVEKMGDSPVCYSLTTNGREVTIE